MKWVFFLPVFATCLFSSQPTAVSEDTALAPQKIIETLIFSDALLNEKNREAFPLGVVIKNLLIPDRDQFIHEMEFFLYQPTRDEVMEAIRRSTREFFHKRGFRVSEVLIPENAIMEQGKILVVVVWEKFGL